jgi:hypothetical protein
VHHAFRHHEALPRGQIDGAILEIDQEVAFDDVEEFVVVVVLVPVVFALELR